MTNKCTGLITHIRHYVELSEPDVAIVERYAEQVELKRREYLVTEGQVCRCNYFVEKGCLRMFYINGKMMEQTTQFALENWWLSDYFSFAKQTPSLYAIQAVEKSLVIAIESQRQDELFAEVPMLESYFRIMMQRALAASQLRVKLIYEFSKEEMYTHFVTSYPQFFQRVPQYMIA